MKYTLLHGNILEVLPTLPSGSIDLCITSPPYWGLRSYGVGEKELGIETTMEKYLDNTMLWVKEVWRVLKPTGSFVLNIGDCFIGGGRGSAETRAVGGTRALGKGQAPPPDWNALKSKGGRDWKTRSSPVAVSATGASYYKAKQLLSVSSFAYCRIVSETDFVCRGEHIWAKPNVPSPIRSRLKHSHEKLFWFVKDADKYYFDAKVWERENKETTVKRNLHPFVLPIQGTSGNRRTDYGQDFSLKKTIEHSWRVVPVGEKQKGFELEGKENVEQFHIAPFPEALISPYVQSLCPQEGCVLDPFIGSGTTMKLARDFKRSAIGIDLNEKYLAYVKKRLNWENGVDENEYEDVRGV